ncbi:MAG: filamentous hemagglutinin N-terminal domain-containing protein, partial [Kiritimatiellae bacterium]|nr:filamentous hemagglutinin N-terminal domain-containing protein [Kiritimatiellia bacterium]
MRGRWAAVLLAAAAFFAAHPEALAKPAADALPLGASDSAGLEYDGAKLTIGPNANTVISWSEGFNIGSSAQVDIQKSLLINKDIGGKTSEIFGQLDSVGAVYIFNPNGILFGNGAQVNVHGLVAAAVSGNGIEDKATSFTFKGVKGNVTVQQNATINAGEFAYLVGKSVSNSGSINAADIALVATSDKLSEEGEEAKSVTIAQADNGATIEFQWGGDAGKADAIGEGAEISGGYVSNDGAISATKAVNAQAVGNVNIDGGSIVAKAANDTDPASGNVTLTALGHGKSVKIGNGVAAAEVEAGIDVTLGGDKSAQLLSGSVTAGGNVTMTGNEYVAVNGNVTGNAVELKTTEDGAFEAPVHGYADKGILLMSGMTKATGGDVKIDSAGVVAVLNGATAVADAGNVAVTAGNKGADAAVISGALSGNGGVTVNAGGNIKVAANVTAEAGDVTLDVTDASSGMSVKIQSGSVSGKNVTLGTVDGEGDAAAMSVQVLNGTVTATGGNVTVNADEYVVVSKNVTASKGDITISTTGKETLTHTLPGGAYVENSPAGVNVLGGTISAKNVKIDSKGSIQTVGGTTIEATEGKVELVANGASTDEVRQGIVLGGNVDAAAAAEIEAVGGAVSLGATKAASLMVTAAGDVTQSAAVEVTGATAVTVADGSAVTLDNAGNKFGSVGAVGKTGAAGEVAIVDSEGDLKLGATKAASLTVTAAGDVTQSAAAEVTGATAVTVADGSVVTLSDAGNKFGSVDAVGKTGAAGEVIIVDSEGDLNLGATKAASLTVTAAGDVTQSAGKTLDVTGLATVTAEGKNITLGNDGNALGSLKATGKAVSVKEDSADGLALDDVTATDTLTITSAGGVTQVAGKTLDVTGLATVTADGDIILANANNDFGSFDATTSAGSILVNDKNALTVSGAKANGTGAGDVRIVAADGLTTAGEVSTAARPGDDTAGNIRLESTAGALTVNGAVNGNNVTLAGGATIGSTKAISAAKDLHVKAVGNIELSADETAQAGEVMALVSNNGTVSAKKVDTPYLHTSAKGKVDTAGSVVTTSLQTDGDIEVSFAGDTTVAYDAKGSVKVETTGVLTVGSGVSGATAPAVTEVLATAGTQEVSLGGGSDGSDPVEGVSSETSSVELTGASVVVNKDVSAKTTATITATEGTVQVNAAVAGDGSTILNGTTGVTGAGSVGKDGSALTVANTTSGGINLTGVAKGTAAGFTAAGQAIGVANENNNFTGDVTAQGASVTLNAANAIVLADVQATSGDVTVTARGKVTATDVKSSAATTITGVGIDAGTVDAEGALKLDAGTG